MSELLLAGLLSGVTMILSGLVVLSKTHGPEFSITALYGFADIGLGGIAAALAWKGTLPALLVPVAIILAGVAVWSLIGGRRRPELLKRCSGFGDLDGPPQ